MCPDCLAAAAKLHHGFSSDCPGCAARAVARGPNFRRARDTGVQDWRYRAELEALKVTHDDVKRAAVADALGKAVA